MANMIVVKLNGNYGTCFDGEVCAWSPEVAKYLLDGRFPAGHPKAGQPFAYPVEQPATSKAK